MTPDTRFDHRFVEFIPEELDDNVLFVSIDYATAVHLCACGCKSQVVTPLSPTDWSLVFDGETASLFPSIGNWSFPCRSHYWLRQGKVVWAPQWSDEEIQSGRALDSWRKGRHLDPRSLPPDSLSPSEATRDDQAEENSPPKSVFEWIYSWLDDRRS